MDLGVFLTSSFIFISLLAPHLVCSQMPKIMFLIDHTEHVEDGLHMAPPPFYTNTVREERAGHGSSWDSASLLQLRGPQPPGTMPFSPWDSKQLPSS